MDASIFGKDSELRRLEVGLACAASDIDINAIAILEARSLLSLSSSHRLCQMAQLFECDTENP